MYSKLKEINKKPELYSRYTAKDLWVDEHRSKEMLKFHLNDEIDVSSNKKTYIEKAVEFMVQKFNLTHEKSIIDFGCGPGLYTNKLAKFTNVSGIDFSENSLNYAKSVAKEQNLSVNYMLGDYLEINLEKKYDLITMIMYDICALSREQRKKLFLKFKSILNDNGKIFFDVFSHSAYEKRVEEAKYEHLQLYGFWSKDDYYAFVNIFKYDEEKAVLDKYYVVEETKEYEVYNWLKYYSVDELKKELLEVGIKVEEVYNNMTGEEYKEDSETIAIIGSL